MERIRLALERKRLAFAIIRYAMLPVDRALLKSPAGSPTLEADHHHRTAPTFRSLILVFVVLVPVLHQNVLVVVGAVAHRPVAHAAHRRGQCIAPVVPRGEGHVHLSLGVEVTKQFDQISYLHVDLRVAVSVL